MRMKRDLYLAMKCVRLRQVWIVATVIATVFITGVIGVRWVLDPMKIAHEVALFELPSQMKLVHEEKKWDGFFGDGYSLWVYDIPFDFEKEVMERCNALGYIRGAFTKSGYRIAVMEQYYDPRSDSCYRLQQVGDGIELSLLSTGRLIIYLDVQ